jgi:hypothetical protein
MDGVSANIILARSRPAASATRWCC